MPLSLKKKSSLIPLFEITANPSCTVAFWCLVPLVVVVAYTLLPSLPTWASYQFQSGATILPLGIRTTGSTEGRHAFFVLPAGNVQAGVGREKTIRLERHPDVVHGHTVRVRSTSFVQISPDARTIPHPCETDVRTGGNSRRRKTYTGQSSGRGMWVVPTVT